jgi:hypothetical protein
MTISARAPTVSAIHPRNGPPTAALPPRNTICSAKMGQEIRDLIHRMSAENGIWFAPRIHGELLKLGMAVSERTASRCLQDQLRDPASRPSCLAFLKHLETITGKK